MASLNKVLLLGNLTRDPETRQVSTGSSVCSMRLAVSRRYTTSRGEDREETCFVDIEVWGRQGENCANYLAKGSPVLVEGRLRLDEWEDRESGQKRSKLLVSGQRVQFIGPPARGSRAFGDEGQSGSAAASPGLNRDRDRDRRGDGGGGGQEPRGQEPRGQEPRGQEPRGQERDAPKMPPFEPVGDDVDDDIPF